MAVKGPTLPQLRGIATDYGFSLSDADLTAFQALMSETLASYARLDQLAEPQLQVLYPRQPGRKARPEENTLNAWYWRCAIEGREDGPLKGMRVAIKDNICVAGVPMMNGSSVLEGYVPEFDATIVTRILDAGAEIVGKAVSEHLCMSGSSFTADTGPVLNPHSQMHSAGGSSSGSAALVVAGECDVAIGGDQGGSIRIPSSWCGAYGLKPSYGLVPYTGVSPIEITLDHVGPMAATVANLATVLEVIAGDDGLDPRQRGVHSERYTQSLQQGVQGLRIGILKEGFGWPNSSEPDVDEAVQFAARRFQGLGAQVRGLSIPMHRDGVHVWRGIAVEGTAMLMVRGNSMGTNWKGHYCTSLLDAYARGRITRADKLADTVKLVVLAGQYMQDAYHGRYYAKAQNLARSLAAAYDAAFKNVDLLVMPTTPMKATRLPAPDASREEKMALTQEMVPNTCPFDVTGHPAVNVPCALSDGLPVGMMLVGRFGEDANVLRAAYAFEQMGGYIVAPAV
jgi:amidase